MKTYCKTILMIAVLCQPLRSEVPTELERLMEQKERAMQKVESTYLREMRDLRAKYVNQGHEEKVKLIDKVLDGANPYKVGNPVVGKWLIKISNRPDVAITRLRDDGTGELGIYRSTIYGTWEIGKDHIIFFRYGFDEAYAKLTLVEGKLHYEIGSNHRKTLMVGTKVADDSPEQ